MKKNEYIEKRENRYWIYLLIFAVFSVALIAFRIYHAVVNDTEPNYLFIIVFVIVAMIVMHYLSGYSEGIYLKYLLASKKLKLILDQNDFIKLNDVYHERLTNGYLWSVYIDKNIYIDVYCDCSKLQKDDIKRLEYQGLTVMHNILRKELSGWFGKMKIAKLAEYLKLQSQAVNEYKLEPIEKKLLEKEEYWT